MGLKATKSRRGFTLIEMLISVTIFSGLVILALGAFARSAISAEKTDALREKTSAARTVVDQIGNDFRYVDSENFTATDDLLSMTLKYPDGKYVKKIYQYNNNLATMRYAEVRCQGLPSDCADPVADDYSNILSSKFKVVQPTATRPIFYAQPSSDNTRGYLKVDLTIAPSGTDLENIDKCSTKAGSCYQLQTTFTAGSYNL